MSVFGANKITTFVYTQILVVTALLVESKSRACAHIHTPSTGNVLLLGTEISSFT